MAIDQAFCNSFKLELVQANHDFSSDTLMLALYDRSTASLGPTTTAYTATGEASGTGYTAGGKEISVSSGYPQANSSIASQIDIRFDSVEWLSATFTAGAGLIYNASLSNAAIAVLDFGTNYTVTNGTFTVTFPTTSPATFIFR